MPWSDEERLERVYRRAQSIRLVRRARFLVAALPLVVVAGALVAAAASPGDGRKLQVAGPTDVTTVTTLPPSPLDSVLPTVPTTVTVPTPSTTPPSSLPTVTTPTTAPRPPDAESCGGYVRGGETPPKPPEGMQVTMSVSKETVRRGEEVVLTLRARWTGSQAFTHTRQGGDSQLVFAHLDGPIFYSSQYEKVKGAAGDETFQPGEEKTYSVRWDTSQACAQAGFKDRWLKAGTYTVEGIWDDTSGTWVAETAQFELVD